MKWEYLIVQVASEEVYVSDANSKMPIDEALNFFGNKGWELVSVTPNGERMSNRYGCFYFKRPRK